MELDTSRPLFHFHIVCSALVCCGGDEAVDAFSATQVRCKCIERRSACRREVGKKLCTGAHREPHRSRKGEGRGDRMVRVGRALLGFASSNLLGGSRRKRAGAGRTQPATSSTTWKRAAGTTSQRRKAAGGKERRKFQSCSGCGSEDQRGDDAGGGSHEEGGNGCAAEGA